MNAFLEKFVVAIFQKPAKALDLGAGNFSDVNDFKKRGWDAEGVDIKAGIDLEKPYLSKNAPFDLIYSNYVLHKLKNKKQLIQTASRNLKGGGWLFVHAFDKSDKNSSSDITQESLKTILSELGFKNIAIRLFDYFDKDPGHNHWHKILEATAQKS